MSYISRACSSLVRQPYYAPNCFTLKISRLETILATKKGRWDGRSFYMDEYTLILLFLAVHKVCTKAILLGERSVRIREVKGSNPSRSTNLPHRFVRCGVFYAQKTLADRAELRTLKSDANRAGSSMCFLKIYRFHASFFAFCRVLRASTSLLCPLLGNPFKNFRTIVG